ncbi:MAG: adenylate/guanylate cyclase domain-containing protein [Verrucomicrobiota bacterium]
MSLESKFLPLVVCTMLALLAWGLSSTSAVQVFEAKAVDLMQRLEYRVKGPHVSDEIVIIAIDDRSVDPESSLFSDVWGKGGWANRENWVFHLQFQKDFFVPRVIAFDILFMASKFRPLSARGEELARQFQMRSASLPKQKLYEVESFGNDAMANLFWDMADERMSGSEAPRPILSLVFPEDAVTRKRLKDNWDWETMNRFAFPAGVVISPEKILKYDSVQLPIEQLISAPVGLGAINTPRDRGGLVRRVPLVYQLVSEESRSVVIPSLSLISFLAYLDIEIQNLKPLGEGVPAMRIEPGRELVLDLGLRQFRVPLDENGRLMLRFRARYRDMDKVGFSDITEQGLIFDEHSGAEMSEQAKAETLIRSTVTDRLAFIAQGFTGGGDIGNFPLEDNIPNVMAHATAVQNLLQSEGLITPSTATRGIGCFLVAGVFWCLWEWMRHRGKSYLPVPFVLLILLIPASCFALFVLHSFLIEVLMPTSIALLLTTLQTTHSYALEAKRRNELKKYFSAAVSPDVLQIIEENQGKISLEGARMEATILFSDVAGFTTISERLEPQELAKLLNRYLTPMTDVILSTDGFVDKYEGDAIMAEWGVPMADPEHARKACKAALMQLQALDILNAQIEQEAGISLAVRMGINSGQVSAGNMGSEKRIQYTVMGDAVNLAARLEPANKEYGSRIIIGEKTYAALSEGEFATRLLDKIVVKGKTKPIDIYELIYPISQHGPWVQDYEAGLRAMWTLDWDQAEACFKSSLEAHPRDLAARNMLQRLQVLRADPPAKGWNGAYIRASKA